MARCVRLRTAGTKPNMLWIYLRGICVVRNHLKCHIYLVSPNIFHPNIFMKKGGALSAIFVPAIRSVKITP